MANGLDGVVAAETVLSEVDGLAGRLVIRGHTLEELAGRWRFEEVLALLLEGFFEQDMSRLGERLGSARQVVFEAMREAGTSATRLHPIDAVRALVTLLPDGEDLDTALQLVAAPAVVTAAAVRARHGLLPLPPDPDIGHAADMARMTQGSSLAPEQAAALEAYLVTVSDHGLNASTFAARVVASTRAGLSSSVLAAISALKGPLHGGAPGPVLDMLDAIGTEQRAAAWIAARLDRGERLMGFGHRIYRVRDPRAEALKRALGRLAAAGRVDPRRLALAEAVERAALEELHRRKPDRRLETNVEFHTALLLEALGFPRETFTCVFAAGRAGGWIAHAREQAATGRLIRPQSRYVGPIPEAAA